MLPFNRIFPILFLVVATGSSGIAQDSTAKTDKWRKNVIRYDLSGGLLFGIDRYVVFGYERVLGPHQSISLNVGVVGLPGLISINTDSFSLSKDSKNSGYNASLDYRFYLAKENKYQPPHGLYIGPYISYNYFQRGNDWGWRQGSGSQQTVNTTTDLYIFTVGGELGYQFVVWKRLAIDLVMIGPGFSRYSLKARINSPVSEENRQQLQDAMQQLLTQKFPGMNYVFSGKEFDANGKIGTWNVGYRYIVHIGFVF
jgi:hypothetical protein